MRELVLFIGLQAAGKSSFYQQRFAGTHEHLSKDLMPKGARDKDARQRAQLERILATGGSAVVDNTNPRAADRAPLVALAHARGARALAYFFEPNVKDSLRRNQAREPRVPAVAIYTTARKLEPPSAAEGFEEIFRVRPQDGSFEVIKIS
jgi:predicted kinase